MPVNFDFITERIAVGQKIDTQEFADALCAAGLTHVINLHGGHEEAFWKENLYLPQEDDHSPRSTDQIRAGIVYAFDALAKGGKVYIHCQWGLGRAPSMAYAILRAFGFSQQQAITTLEFARPKCAAWTWKEYIPSIEEALCR